MRTDTNMQPKIMKDDQGYPIFIMEVTKVEDHCAIVNVEEVSSWDIGEAKEPREKSPYLHAYIKWEGCSHVQIGDIRNDDERDGYLHLCGVIAWKRHIKVMEWVYREATALIKNMDQDELW